MRHQQKRHKLGRDKAHREALLKNLAKSLFEHVRIRTTLAKAKALRPFAEKLITKAVKANKTGNQILRVHYFRLIRESICDETVASTLLKVWGRHFIGRPGGYLRIIKLGQRRSDAAPMAIVELIGETWDVGSGASIGLQGVASLKQKSTFFFEQKLEFNRLSSDDRWKAACLGPVPKVEFTLLRGTHPWEFTLKVQVGPRGFFSEEIDRKLFPIDLFIYCNEGGHKVSAPNELPEHVHLEQEQIRIEWVPSESNMHFDLRLSSETDNSNKPPVVRLVRENGATAALGKLNLK